MLINKELTGEHSLSKKLAGIKNKKVGKANQILTNFPMKMPFLFINHTGRAMVINIEGKNLIFSKKQICE